MEMETSLHQMMARLLAEMKASQAEVQARAETRQEKMNAEMEARAEARQEKAAAHAKARHEEAAARQEKANAELKAAMHSMRSDTERSLHQQMRALLEGSQSFGTRTTICRIPPVACPEETETTSCPEEMDARRLVNQEETEAALERQGLREKEINFENIGSSEDRCGDRRLVVRRRRGAKKRIQDSVGSRQKLSSARKQVVRRAVLAVR
jgi:hypothetical protein